jgi:hypothetical protein
MKLTIDTKEDTHDEIRKAIRMLSTIVGDEHVYTNSPPKAPVANIFESSSNTVEPSTSSEPAQGNIFGNMFGDMNSSSSPSTGTSEEKKDEDDEAPQVIVEY